MGYFKKHWSEKIQEDVAKCTEEAVWEKYSPD